MNEQEKIDQFNRDLEAAIGGRQDWTDGEDSGRLAVSRRLAASDFSGRSTRRVETRAHVLSTARRGGRTTGLGAFARTAAGAVVLILVVAGIGWLALNLPVQPAVTADPPDPMDPLALEVIVFETDRDGNAEIYRMFGDGSETVNLTRNPAEDTSPAWSPLGDRIAFFSDRMGKIELFSMDPDGGGLLQLTDEADIRWHGPITWSPDGTALAVAGSPLAVDENHAGLYLVYAEGGISGAPYTDVPVRSPLWLPDGTGLAIVSFDAEAASAAVLTLDLRTGEALDLTARLESAGSSAPYLIQGLAASPDGQKLAYLAYYRKPFADNNLLGSSIAAIQVFDRASGTNETLLEITPLPNGLIGLSWSPDGNYLSFVRSVGMTGCWQVHVLRLADLEEGAAEGLCYLSRTLFPDWSPDGRWLVYPADEDGSNKDYALVAVDVPALFEDSGGPAVQWITANDGAAHSPQVRPVREPVERPSFPAEIEPAGPTPAPFPAAATVILPDSDDEAAVLRSGPGTAYGSPGAVAAGVEVSVLAESENGEWCRIEFPGMPDGEVWIYRAFLDFNTAPGPLTAESTDAEIRARLLESRLLWDTLFVDARVESESKGETHLDRQQAWIDQPSLSRWLSGQEGEAPSLLRITDGIDAVLITGDGERQEYSTAVLQIGELETILFPAHFAARPGTFEAVRIESTARRTALVVEWHDDFDHVRDRLWIDVETGLVLRWENLFPGAPDAAGRVQPSAVWIEEVRTGVDIPEGAFDPDQELEDLFSAGPTE